MACERGFSVLYTFKGMAIFLCMFTMVDFYFKVRKALTTFENCSDNAQKAHRARLDYA